MTKGGYQCYFSAASTEASGVDGDVVFAKGIVRVEACAEERDCDEGNFGVRGFAKKPDCNEANIGVREEGDAKGEGNEEDKACDEVPAEAKDCKVPGDCEEVIVVVAVLTFFLGAGDKRSSKHESIKALWPCTADEAWRSSSR